MTFLASLASTFAVVLLPILLLVALGALVQKFHPLDVGTLSKLQIYLFVPAFLFVRVLESSLSWRQIAGVAGAILLAKVLLAVPLWFVLRRLDAPRPTSGVFILSAVVFNAGNFGIPLAERAYGKEGGAVQALVVMMSNLTLWGVGYGLLAAMSGQGRRAVLGYFRLPMLYVLAAALALRGLRLAPPGPVMYTLHLVADGLVPVALVTLGAQLARGARWPRWKMIAPLLVAKLFVLPLVMAGVVWAFGMWPWPGALLIVSTAAPTAVNTLLLTIEQKGDVEFAADCVFWTTLLSAVSVTLILAAVQALGGFPS